MNMALAGHHVNCWIEKTDEKALVRIQTTGDDLPFPYKIWRMNYSCIFVLH